MENNNIKITIDLNDVLSFVNSIEFNTFLKNNTTISNGLFISEVLTKTIQYMMQDIAEEQESKNNEEIQQEER